MFRVNNVEPQRSVKIKIEFNFFSSSGTGTEKVNERFFITFDHHMIEVICVVLINYFENALLLLCMVCMLCMVFVYTVTTRSREWLNPAIFPSVT